MPLDQNVLILFCEYWNNLAQKTIYEDLLQFKILYKFCLIFWNQNVLITYSIDTSRPNYFDDVCNQYILWDFLGILTQKIMHKYLIWFKSLYQFYQFFLSDFLEENVLIPPSQNIPQEAKCFNPRKLDTTQSES